MKNILVTGSAGYIGSICTYRLLKNNYNVIAFDNLSTGHIETIEKLKQFGTLEFIKGDLKNKEDIEKIFKNKIDAVIHFASYSQVGEGEINPIKYYENNIVGAINLFQGMIKNNVKKIVFSSSAAIYGNVEKVPIDENQPKNPVCVYGRTKLMIENILSDLFRTNGIKSAALRYFNVCGASKDFLFGEWHEPETHLIPNVLNNNNLKIFGNDYNTKDGTCIRDYIDVEDLVEAHILACKYLENNENSIQVNLGTENGNSIFDIIKLCEEEMGVKINYEILDRRLGDAPILTASNKKARKLLNWTPQRSLKDSIHCAFEYKKQTKN